MAKLLEVETIGFRDALGRFAKAGKELVPICRDLVREAGRLYIAALKRKAPVGKHYTLDGMSYSTYALQKSFSFKTFKRASGLELRTYSSSPYIQYVIGETRKNYTIPGAPLLVFYWPKLGGPVFFRRVTHPGTAANPFHREAYEEELPKIRLLLNKAGARTFLNFRM